MTDTSLLVDHRDAATTVLTLNRPERRNALTVDLMRRLCRTMEELASDPARRVVILHGAGPAFCAGLDLHEAGDAESVDDGPRWVARTFRALSESALVTVAAVHGAAYAGGAGVMSSCDLVVASEDLRVCFPEVRRGLVPALVSAVLTHQIPVAILTELLLLAEPIGAHRARELGLVHRIAAEGDLLGEAEAMVLSVLEGAPDAVRRTKQLLRDLRQVPSERALDVALEWHLRARHGPEAAEGIAAFRERREPRW